MPGLWFRYGTVSSGKTVRLLVEVHQYNADHTGKKAYILKPALDQRQGEKTIWCRPGLTTEANLVLAKGEQIATDQLSEEKISCIFVDEAQWLTKEQVSQLRLLSLRIPVICYGIRTNFRGELFEGSAALLAQADKIEEIKVICKYCPKKATYNLRLEKGVPTLQGPSIQIGCEELYLPVCFACYCSKLSLNQPTSK